MLTLSWVLPLAGALLLLLVGNVDGRRDGLIRWVALAFSILTFGVISTILALSGIVVAWLIFLKKRVDVVAFATDHPGLYNFLYKKWYFDEVYNDLIVFPMRRLAMYLWQVVDVKVIDGTLMGIARGVDELSRGLRTLQTGLVRNYALAIALGMVVIVGVYFAAFSDLFR